MPDPNDLQLSTVSSKGTKPVQLTQRQTKELKFEFKKYLRARIREAKLTLLRNTGIAFRLLPVELYHIKQQALQQFAQEKGLADENNSNPN